jgi:serine/threonine-protein kinase RsbW
VARPVTRWPSPDHRPVASRSRPTRGPRHSPGRGGVATLSLPPTPGRRNGDLPRTAANGTDLDLHHDTYTATADAIPSARRAVEEALSSAGVPDGVRARVTLAVSEAVTNVVQHAYRDGPPGLVRVTVALDETVVVTVADDGGGLAPRADSPGLGLGLGLMARSSDGINLSDGHGDGTTVEMRFDLTARGPGAP